MGYLLDTNILSELRKGNKCNGGVSAWFSQTNSDELYVSVLILGEIRRGVEQIRLRDPIAGQSLEQWLQQIENNVTQQVLPVNKTIADRWGRLNVPNLLPAIDGLLAATALEHDLTLVTRNVRDVERSGVRLLNPFI
ncbi:MAG: type II toxin-antitoxin system VapC family toxin [Methylovulum sp.]|uniref:type II toxin-antitoxin system VapC family toxin n=1 Tax=Methylovulum sp. TaxID=1916980 RepID=UPI00262D118C|nr:type II toxin-antitoxin system VapC family toxin [Methylovulum sp.]MDD2723217.1 type II toxin-antitoxin system VapC family toxin [Methylovulum sp.]MDD5123158.1 type II toxin-antitoxin system VapC family toxin [Methylovulum sp.]